MAKQEKEKLLKEKEPSIHYIRRSFWYLTGWSCCWNSVWVRSAVWI